MEKSGEEIDVIFDNINILGQLLGVNMPLMGHVTLAAITGTVTM